MVKVAADWRRLGSDTIPEDQLFGLADAYLHIQGVRSRAEYAEEALNWATGIVYGALQLLEPVNGEWRAFDFLVDYIASIGDPIPDVTWREGVAAARQPGQAVELGFRAYVANRVEDTEMLWRSAAD